MTNTPTLAIRRLTLTAFRSYAALRLETGAQLVALTGANGAGKTNILEAVSLLTPGRGLRGASFEELARQGLNSVRSHSLQVRDATTHYVQAHPVASVLMAAAAGAALVGLAALFTRHPGGGR